MTAGELLLNLDAVRPRGPGKWSARCPSHVDTSPSLTIAEGERALLVKCWAGCTLHEITDSLHLSVKDLFFDTVGTDSRERRQAIERRRQAKAKEQAAYRTERLRMDALREAEALIHSACGISIEQWSDEHLHRALEKLGAAYQLLESEAV